MLLTALYLGRDHLAQGVNAASAGFGIRPIGLVILADESSVAPTQPPPSDAPWTAAAEAESDVKIIALSSPLS